MYTTRVSSLLLLTLIVLVVLVCGTAGANGDCPKLKNITKQSLIVTGTNELEMTASTTALTDGTVVSLQCNDHVTLTLSGPGIIRCKGGKWDPPQPHCVKKPPPPEPNNPHLDTIIGGVLAGCLIVLILVSIPEMVKRGRAWRLNKLQEAAKLLEEDNQKRFYKVWTCRRNTKQFIRASGLKSLKHEASKTFKKPSIARIVLEEDGTEVDSDDILDACADLTLMALAEGELWWDRNINSDDGRLDEKRLTFDICNQDRTKRKLILASDLRDLYRQGQLVFGYLPSRACLESDGTVIDQNALFTFAESTIMLLEQDGIWLSSLNPSRPSFVYTLPDLDRSSVQYNPNDGMMFKVWSSDHVRKLVVFAVNLAELHIKAAKAHKVPNPIEITELSTGDVITSDAQLTSLANQVLIIKSTKYASDNFYQTFEHQIDDDSKRHKNDYFPNSEHYNYVPAPRNITNIPQEHVSSTSGPRNGNKGIRSENRHVYNGLPPLENGYISKDRSNHDDALPSRMSGIPMNKYDGRRQNNPNNSLDTKNEDPRSLAKNNFGFLRDMSDGSHRKSSVHEMSEFNKNEIYPSQHHSNSRPMLITGGAKQNAYSDVLF